MRAFVRQIPISIIFIAIIILSCSSKLHAQADIYIRGAGKLIPIALPRLCKQQGDSQAVSEIPKIVAKDLELSGFFEVISPDSYIEAPGKCGGPEGVTYTDWSVLGTEGLVRGEVSSNGNRLSIRMYLYEVQKRAMVLGKEYEGDIGQVNKIAHKFANEVMKHFTGEIGPFGTQVAFSSKIGRFKELFVMGMDGSDIRQLTNDRGLALSSSWSGDGSHLLYTTYRLRVPDIFKINVASRAITQITRNDILELGAKYPNGMSSGDFITSTTTGRDSDIVILNQSGGIAKKLTGANGAIDLSPEYSPDNSKIVFCSNRAGGPQIYTMNSDGSNAKRISFVSSNYCTSPAWSPKGDKIAYVCRADSGFNIFVSRSDGSEPMQLTSNGSNEDPDWSPEGRYLIFSSTQGGGGVFNLWLMRDDGSSPKQITKSRGGDSEPSWGPIS